MWRAAVTEDGRWEQEAQQPGHARKLALESGFPTRPRSLGPPSRLFSGPPRRLASSISTSSRGASQNSTGCYPRSEYTHVSHLCRV